MSISNLIDDYLAAVEECLVRFQRTFGRRDILRAWREGALPTTGKLAGEQQYQMHGVGCQVSGQDQVVDFDFVNGEGDVGFDAWRLWLFAKQFPERYPDLSSRTEVEDAVSAYLTAGKVVPAANNSDLLRRIGDF